MIKRAFFIALTALLFIGGWNYYDSQRAVWGSISLSSNGTMSANWSRPNKMASELASLETCREVSSTSDTCVVMSIDATTTPPSFGGYPGWVVAVSCEKTTDGYVRALGVGYSKYDASEMAFQKALRDSANGVKECAVINAITADGSHW